MPFLSIFLHAFSVFDLSVICSPNGKTAEPEYYRQIENRKSMEKYENMDENGNWFYGAEENEAIKKGASKEMILLKYTSTMTPTAHGATTECN